MVAGQPLWRSYKLFIRFLCSCSASWVFTKTLVYLEAVIALVLFCEHRHSKTRSMSSQSSCGTNGALVPLDAGVPIASTSSPCNALALTDPPAPVRTMKEQDMIDFLSLTLSTSTSPHTPPVSKTMPQIHVSSNTQGYPYVSQTYPVNHGPIPYNSYVVPWAQPQTQQHQVRPPSQPQLQHQTQQHQLPPPSQPLQQLQPQPQQQAVPQPQLYLQPQSQPQLQPQFQLQHPRYSSCYPPPPWAATTGNLNNQNHMSATNNMFSSPRANKTASYTPVQAARPVQQFNSFPTKAGNGSTMNGDPWMSSTSRIPAAPGQKQSFVPPYRLFEDLNVLGNADGRYKMTSSRPPSLG